MSPFHGRVGAELPGSYAKLLNCRRMGVVRMALVAGLLFLVGVACSAPRKGME